VHTGWGGQPNGKSQFIQNRRPGFFSGGNAKSTMNKEDRLPQLDALRGLAAFAVFWGHAFAMMPATPALLLSIQHTPLHFFYDGSAAVMLFFVLSGFVLNLRYAQLSDYPRHWDATFIISRFFRIYPAFIAAIGLGLFVRHFLYDPSTATAFSAWFSKFWRDPLMPGKFLRMLTLIGPGIDSDQINPPIWSLKFEMRISLFFPLVILITNFKRKPVGDLMLLAAVYVGSFILCRENTFLYVPQFVLGAVCAKRIEHLKSALSRASRPAKAAWMVGALLLYQAGSLQHEFDSTAFRFNYLIDQIVGLGAAGFIVGCIALVRIKTLLNQQLFQFIGRTSYSFYLLHFMLLIGLSPEIYRVTHSLAVCWISVLLLTYLLAILVFETIELPLIRLGKRIAAAFVARWH
jgi:peptidoglycan/LPS O-acetylase OafA/YrhL